MVRTTSATVGRGRRYACLLNVSDAPDLQCAIGRGNITRRKAVSLLKAQLDPAARSELRLLVTGPDQRGRALPMGVA
jgi:hypothetical protein